MVNRNVHIREDDASLRHCGVYDTAGRCTLLATTRDDGATWDETRWEYDAESGLNRAKVYADGSRISYAYAADGKKTRTTWARGAWRENAYNARRLVSGTTYSDETPSVTCEYDAAGRLSSATLANGDAYCYQRDERLLVTNEVVRIASNEFAVVRTYDVFRRAQETTVVEDGIRYASKARFYDSENRVCGYALTNAAGKSALIALAYDGSLLMNKTFMLPNGKAFIESLTRSTSRRELVTRRAYSFDDCSIYQYSTDYDILGRPTNAVDSVSWARAWVYNRRSELVAAMLGTNTFGYVYDTIGNLFTATLNASTNTYSANLLNQYTSILRGSVAPCEKNLAYEADGNLTSDGSFSCAYDAENRLVSVLPITPTNGSFAVENRYDHRHRRTQKVVSRFADGEWSAYSTHTYVWDGNNIVLERIAFADGTERVCEYFWGADKSGTEQNAGGVGGLLAVSIDGVFYLTCYDHNGNIVAYVSETGDLAAQFVYDPYGNVIEQYGAQASQFSFGFSTKIQDREIGLVSYQRRFYSPALGRWLNRDPLEEQGGENLYAFCVNVPIYYIDDLGLTFKDDLIDSAKIVVGVSTMISGATLGASTSWTGVGAVGGFAMMALGADQMLAGIRSLYGRISGGPSSDSSPVKDVIRFSSTAITGQRNSRLEQYALSTYDGIQLASSCYGGYVAVRHAVNAIQMIHIPSRTVRIMSIDRGMIRYSWELKVGYWRLNGMSEAGETAFEISVNGMTYLEYDTNEVYSAEGGRDVND